MATRHDGHVLDSVKDVIYEFMGEPDKLSELSKLVGKLRFASEGHEGFYNRSLIEEVESEILSLARYLPVNYNIKSLIQSTKLESDSGSVLAQLYLERCYKLYEEDYIELQNIEDKIKSFKPLQCNLVNFYICYIYSMNCLPNSGLVWYTHRGFFRHKFNI